MGDMTQGMPIAQEALTKAQAFYGEDTSHPVTALCLTTYGYYLKGNGNSFDRTIQEAQVGVGRVVVVVGLRGREGVSHA